MTTVSVPGREDQVGNPHRALARRRDARSTGVPHLDGGEAVARRRAARRVRAARGRPRRRSPGRASGSSTGASSRTPPRSPRSRCANRTARTASASAGSVAHATARVRATPRSGPRRAPRAITRGRSTTALISAEHEDRDGDRECAGRGIPQPARRDRPEQHDVRERRGQPHLGEVEQHRAGAVGAVEQHPVDDPDDHEPGGEHRRGAQGFGSNGHGARKSARPARRSA